MKEIVMAVSVFALPGKGYPDSDYSAPDVVRFEGTVETIQKRLMEELKDQEGASVAMIVDGTSTMLVLSPAALSAPWRKVKNRITVTLIDGVSELMRRHIVA